MGKINVLSFEIANLIAAGEVVERPSSVLKELIENSIDSGATSIVAEIKNGGVSLIRVTDNGSGIDKDDLPIALKRHATSKIQNKSDLDSIMTLGFRGEALAAISSVSTMTIITKTKNAEVGSMLTAEAGRVVDVAEVCSADGTTVVVNDLFYNVPARRKFLKKDSTEAMNVTALVEKVALSRPDISIQLLIDGEEKFKTPGDGDLYSTVYAIFGRAFAEKTIKTEGVANGIKVYGFIGRSDNVKKNRNLLNVFINGRYVKSLTAQAAIEKAYTSYIAPECFPTCVLFIEMNPSMVDVNVHPAKLEVKFADERSVFEAVYYTVKNALEEHEYRPEMQLGAKKTAQNLMSAFVPLGADTRGEQISLGVKPMPYIKEGRSSSAKDEGFGTSTPYKKKEDVYKKQSYAFSENTDGVVPLRSSAKSAGSQIKPAATVTPKDSIELLERYRDSKKAENYRIEEPVEHTEVSIQAQQQIPQYKFVGEAFDCYVIIEYEGALLVIDKHAAHERVIFEDLKSSRNADGRVASQLLMLPLTVTLSHEELACAEEFKSELSAVGFDFSQNSGAVDITSIPDAISAFDAEGLFVQMLDEIIDGRGRPEITEAIRREKALYQIACKAAIKGGRVYDRAILEWLIAKVLSLPDITVCPHGRPIAFRLTKSELDRQFERLK